MKRAFILLAFLISTAAACTGNRAQFENGCLKNEDCPVGAYCRRATASAEAGLCACRTDEACGAGEICNSQGICQKRQDCRSNVDCEASRFCDLGSGACLERTQCGLDLHCLPGQICGQNNLCADGCTDNADCPLYQVCEANRCVSGKCGDRTYCDYGERCVNGACIRPSDPNYCKDCDPRVDGSCGSFDNFCLINSSYDPNNPRSGGPNFCGVECTPPADDSQEDPCPNGYDCGSVVLLTSDQCTNNNECGGGGRFCAIGEGQLRGFCTCASNADCDFNQAPPLCSKSCGGLGLQPCMQNSECFSNNCAGSCQWPQGQQCSDDSQCQPLPICAPAGPGGQLICVTDGSPCNTAADCQCSMGRCIASGRTCNSAADCDLPCAGGGCLLGFSCAPIQGLLCPDVR